MSVAIVKCGQLCDLCVLYTVPHFNDAGNLQAAIEVNDMCTACMSLEGVYVRDVSYVYEMELVKRVEKLSPWCWSMRWQQRWNSWGFPLCLAAVCITFLMLATWLAMKIGESIVLGML